MGQYFSVYLGDYVISPDSWAAPGGKNNSESLILGPEGLQVWLS